MEAELVEQLTGKIFKSEKAVLKGFKRYQVINEPYPAIVRDKSSEVDGLLLRNVDEKSMEIFVAYEGIQYKTKRVLVIVGDIKVNAFVC